METASDGRTFPFFQVENAVIDNFGALLGPYGLAVYVCIVRHVNHKSGVAFPSMATIAAETGMRRNRVVKAVKDLRDLGLIRVQPRKRDDGGQTSNEYELVNVTPLTPPHVPGPESSTATEPPPCIPEIQPPVSDEYSPCIPGIHEQDEVNQTKEQDSGATAPPAPPTPTKPPKPDYWGDLVAETLTAFDVGRGVGARLAEQLAGVATKGARKEHNCEPPALPGDVAAFVVWYRKEHGGIDLPTSAESLALWWHRYKASARPGGNGSVRQIVYTNGMTREEFVARLTAEQMEVTAA